MNRVRADSCPGPRAREAAGERHGLRLPRRGAWVVGLLWLACWCGDLPARDLRAGFFLRAEAS